jgi:alpha-glucosidase
VSVPEKPVFRFLTQPLPFPEYDLITVGETPFTYDTEEIAAYVLPKNKEFQMAFQFGLMDIDSPLEGEDVAPLVYKPWKLSDLKDVICRGQTFKREEGFWNAYVLKPLSVFDALWLINIYSVFTENHDIARSVSRFGDDSTDESRIRSAKMLALLQLTQSGTQFIFQGQELGLKNFPRTWGIDEYKDAASQNFWNK